MENNNLNLPYRQPPGDKERKQLVDYFFGDEDMKQYGKKSGKMDKMDKMKKKKTGMKKKKKK